MATDLFAPLSAEHQGLVDLMAMRYLRDGQWPVWQHVEHELDRHDLDAEKLIRTLPMVGSDGPVGPSYGLAWYDRFHLDSNSRPALTMAAALHVQELRQVWERPFLSVLKLFIEVRLGSTVDPGASRDIMIDRDEVLRALPSLSPPFMARLPELLDHEPATRGSWQADAEDGSWKRTLSRELRKYQRITTLDEYVRRVATQIEEAVSAYIVPTVVAASVAPTPAASSAVYIHEPLIEELEQKRKSTSWHLDKLLGLLRELNDNHEAGNPYACAALLRAVLDHVPPVFGMKNFDEVASSYAWTTTDKAYMKKLAEFRKTADDVLHRQIRRSADVLSMHDLPLPSYVNALLRECVNKL